MSDHPAEPRDVPLPGQEFEALDLDPKIEPEWAADSPPDDLTAKARPDAADVPELGNTLIDPGNS